jgi:CxxC-x17-CxxC domain-containing protein
VIHVSWLLLFSPKWVILNQLINQPIIIMKNFNRDRDNKGFGRRGFGGRDGGDREMFKATCAECGESCEVPFRPSGDKPVFCSSCFNKNDDRRGGRDDRRDDRRGGRDFGGRRDDRRDGGRPDMHHAVCATCGKDCEVPFRPTGDKPIYCSDCFTKAGRGGASKGGNQSNEQLNALNAKLDKLINFLMPKEAQKEVEPKKSKKEKKAEVKEVVKEVKEAKKKVAKKKTAKKK